jgi:hypothetical protein
MIRARVESRRSRVTSTSSAPRPLIAPAALLHRQRFAGDRRLVDEAEAVANPAVERDLLPRPDDDVIADADLVDGDNRVDAAATHQRRRRRKVHQGADCAAGALHRAPLEHLRQRKQEDDRRALRPLAERHRAGDGDHHQDVDVEVPREERAPGAPRRLRPGQDHRCRVRHPDQRSEDREILQYQPGDQRQAGQRHQPLARERRPVRPRLLVLEPCPHARLSHRLGDPRRRQLRGVVLDPQLLADDVGVQRFEPGQRLQAVLEDRDLLVAIHALDTERRLGVQLTNGAGHRRQPFEFRASNFELSSTCVIACVRSSRMW